MDTTNFKYETDILLKEYFATEDEEAAKEKYATISFSLVLSVCG